MSYLTWMSFLSYNIITSITPGPMNIIAMNVAGNQGVRGGRSIYAGLILGLTVVILLCGLFSSTLVAILPNLIQYMRFIGSAYIMWIAWVILRSRPESVDGQSTELNFNRAFLLLFINVKAYIWLTNKEGKDFRTEEFEINFLKNENADEYVPTEEQIDVINTLITIEYD